GAGLAVPLALAAGRATGASSHIVVTAGMGETAAGAISMGLGGYLAGRSDVDHYESERSREIREVRDVPAEEEAEVRRIFEQYGLQPSQVDPIVSALRARPQAWVDFMMRFELGLEEPAPGRARAAALTIGGAYPIRRRPPPPAPPGAAAAPAPAAPVGALPPPPPAPVS